MFKTRTSMLISLLGAAVLGTGSACIMRGLESEPENIVNFQESRPLGKESGLRVSVNFKVGDILVRAAPAGVLYTVDSDYDSVRYKPELNYDPGTQRLDFSLRSVRDGTELPFRWGSDDASITKNRLHLLLSPAVELELELRGGIGETNINLTGLQTRALEIESGVSQTFLSCEQPNPVVCERLRFRAGVGEFEALRLGNLNFRRLEFEGGVGSSELDFSGQWRHHAEVTVRVGVGELVVLLPDSIGAEVDSQKRFLSGLHLESFTQRGDSYFSDNYDEAATRVRFRLQTGIGSIRVKRL